MAKQKDAYARAGVDYDLMDPYKRYCQKLAAQTDNVPVGWKVIKESRGESAFVKRHDRTGLLLATVEEGLGTKNYAADRMFEMAGEILDYQAAKSAVATIINDLITVGARPAGCAQHLAVGSSKFFENEKRWIAMAKGWRDACIEAGCTWEGGETPTLRRLMDPRRYILAGSANGEILKPHQFLHGGKIHDKAAIMMFASSGIHDNGLTLAHDIADDKLKDGYLTKLPSGMTYGKAALTPTIIYAKLMRALQEAEIPIQYAPNITGHGLRKIMRAKQPFAYLIEKIPEPQEIFHFIQEQHGISDADMYGNYNMGMGFAVFVAQRYAVHTRDVAIASGYDCWQAGTIRKTDGEQYVHIIPKGLKWGRNSLKVR